VPPDRRAGSADSKTRTSILEAAERILLEEGHGAVTSRAVAARAGIHAGNVHYYFPTLDDLFVALLDRGADRNLRRIGEALADAQPLKALWRLSSGSQGVGLLNELMAAAGHREPLRVRVSSLADDARRMQVDALRTLLPQYGLDEAILPPELVAAMLQGTALLVARETARDGGPSVVAVTDAAEALIDLLEAHRASNEPAG